MSIIDGILKTPSGNKLEIITILDRSGSMNDIRQDTIGGYNGFLMGQKALPGYARATLVTFSHDVETLYEGVNVQHLGNLTQANYATVGSTSLLDAIGTTLTRQLTRIEREGWADKVLVNIVTDGEENTSREFTLDQVKALVKACQNEKGWKFVFEGADIDSFKVGAGLGISGATTRNFTKTAAGVAESYGNLTAYATSMRTEAR